MISRFLQPSLVTALVLALAGGGCATIASKEIILGPSFEPTNISSKGGELPEEFRRVAVLPLTGGDADTRRALQDVLHAELSQARRFEAVPVSREGLRTWTGRTEWSIHEVLPANLLTQLRSKYHCDGVIFAELTQVRVYAPLRLGWKITLADTEQGRAIWTADEVFDSSDPAVSNGARRHYSGSRSPRNAAPDTRFILLSPTAFGHYTARTLLQYLPYPKAAKYLPVPADNPIVTRSAS